VADNLGDHLFNGDGITDVGFDGQRLDASLLGDLTRSGLGMMQLRGDNGDVGTGLSQSQGRDFAQPSGPAGHQSFFAIQAEFIENIHKADFL
jgi:hypothetical protein